MAGNIAELRRLLEERFPDALPVAYRTTAAVATGVRALDRILPGGGLPRGRVSSWVPGGGATAVLRAACEAVVRRGERAAWVEGRGVEAGFPWGAGPMVVRPSGARDALLSAEELLRSGGFGLVVLVGPALPDVEGVRLSRAAREGGSALVVVSDKVRSAAVRLRSRIAPEGYRWRRGALGEPVEVEAVEMEVEVRAPGANARTVFQLPVARHEVRLSLEPGRVDRRGAGV